MGGHRIEPEDWDLDRLPGHLVVTFAVHDGPGPEDPLIARATT